MDSSSPDFPFKSSTPSHTVKKTTTKNKFFFLFYQLFLSFITKFVSHFNHQLFSFFNHQLFRSFIDNQLFDFFITRLFCCLRKWTFQQSWSVVLLEEVLIKQYLLQHRRLNKFTKNKYLLFLTVHKHNF